jgi:transcription elongation GreA/GreB family factor
MPVKLSDDLVKLARAEAVSARRSITAQIEHWAELGRSLESALPHAAVRALKQAGGNVERAFPQLATRQAVLQLLTDIASAKDRSALADTLRQGRVVYQANPDDTTRIMQIAADGRRTVGRFIDRQFVPATPAKRRTKG